MAAAFRSVASASPFIGMLLRALVTLPALAGTYDEGLRQYGRQDYRAAFVAFHRAGDAGDAAAMRRIGLQIDI